MKPDRESTFFAIRDPRSAIRDPVDFFVRNGPKQDGPAKSDANMKAYAKRIVGLTVTFKEGHSLLDFC